MEGIALGLIILFLGFPVMVFTGFVTTNAGIGLGVWILFSSYLSWFFYQEMKKSNEDLRSQKSTLKKLRDQSYE